MNQSSFVNSTTIFFFFFFFFCGGRSLCPPRINKGATSALWLTSDGAPLDCRLVPNTRLARGSQGGYFQRTKQSVKARWIGDDPRVISHSDPSSGDSIEPIRSQVSKHPPGMVDIYSENLPPPVADGPARWLSWL